MDAANKEVDPADEEAKGGSGEVLSPPAAFVSPSIASPLTACSRRAAGGQDALVIGHRAARPAVLRAGVEAGQVQRVRMDEGRP